MLFQTLITTLLGVTLLSRTSLSRSSAQYNRAVSLIAVRRAMEATRPTTTWTRVLRMDLPRRIYICCSRPTSSMGITLAVDRLATIGLRSSKFLSKSGARSLTRILAVSVHILEMSAVVFNRKVGGDHG